MQKTEYEVRISDWSSYVCASDLNREQAASQSAQLHAFLQRQYAVAQRGAMPSAALLASAEQALMQRFDRQWGGFGGAPKFPHSSDLELRLSSDQIGRESCRERGCNYV